VKPILIEIPRDEGPLLVNVTNLTHMVDLTGVMHLFFTNGIHQTLYGPEAEQFKRALKRLAARGVLAHHVAA